ncbi:U32 family peptidase [Methanosalsum natronophilum]|uniref:U32 family peptidase n=1 Tax=Methanosalsum natronophilum TaxID=768733 RepID=A0A424YV23_9EURY|nr:MAG: U32 family peptidase [Methanosalsum natronophilum]
MNHSNFQIPELVAGIRNIATLNACKDYVEAVYFSLDSLSLRARAKDITKKSLPEFVQLIHENDLKAYLTINSVIYPQDMEELNNVMDIAKSSEVDAVICWDPAAIIKALDNDLKVHISTQANVSNIESVKFYHSLGAERVVLARELSLDNINDIRKQTTIELEVFVHGAMCQSISGRCYLSSHLLGKSANCGECTQPCRWKWSLVSDDGTVIDLNGNYLLSAKDLCMIEHLSELVDIGIDAFKIEGRLRDSRYISKVASSYSRALSYLNYDDDYSINLSLLKDELSSVYNRGFSTGYYFGNSSKHNFMIEHDMNASTTKKKAIGIVTNYYNKQGAALIHLQQGSISLGDVMVIEGKTTFLEQTVNSIVIDGVFVEHAAKSNEVGIKVDQKVRKNDIVFKLEQNQKSFN